MVISLFFALHYVIQEIKTGTFILQKVHPNVQKAHVDRRLEKLKDGRGLDWATAETLAFGSLLYQGKLLSLDSFTLQVK